MFCMGLGILVAVPAFKTVTHLPPFLGILFGLGILWLVGDLIHRHKEDEYKQHLTLAHALSKIDMSSLVFFIGILLAVATLEHTHILTSLAQWLDHSVGRLDVIVLLIGMLSAIVDNVPLVAASMGMYDLKTYPTDRFRGVPRPTAPALAVRSSSSVPQPVLPRWASRRSTSWVREEDQRSGTDRLSGRCRYLCSAIRADALNRRRVYPYRNSTDSGWRYGWPLCCYSSFRDWRRDSRHSDGGGRRPDLVTGWD